MVLAVGIGLRLAAAFGRGLWIDEAFTYEVVTSSPRDALRLMLEQDFSPPLWSLICWMVVAPFRLAGMGAEGISTLIRLIAVAMFPPAVAVLVASIKRGAMSASAALMAGWLLAIAPVLVRTGSDARMYALVVPTLLLAIGVARWAAVANSSQGWPVGVGFLLLAMSHYYGFFVAVGLLVWLAATPGSQGATRLVERARSRRSALLWGGTAIGFVAPMLVWHVFRTNSLRDTAHILPARYPVWVWLPWVTVGLAAIWVAVLAALLAAASAKGQLARPSTTRGWGAATVGACALVLATSITFFQRDGLHAVNTGFATVVGVCLAVSAADRLSELSGRTLSVVAAVALASSMVPLVGVIGEARSMGRPGAYDLAAMAHAVADDANQRTRAADSAPVVWIQEWSWGDRYLRDVIAEALDGPVRFAHLATDSAALGALSGSPTVNGTDIRLALQASGARSAIINRSSTMYVVSRGRIVRSDLEHGLSGCGFEVQSVAPFVFRAVRPAELTCR